MSNSLALGLFAFLLINQSARLPAPAPPQEAAKNVQLTQSGAPLRNEDVAEMLRAELSPEVILARVQSSPCGFDTSSAALQRLKAEGASDAVVLAMVRCSLNAPPSSADEARGGAVVKIPAGARVEIEAAFTISSQEVRAGDVIGFRVVNPLIVGGVTLIAPGAAATGRVVKASRGGHFGRAGRLAWSMHEVTAVDGTRIPVRFSGRTVGDSKSAKVVTQTVVVGALLGPFAPLSLMHGFKRGENAYIPAGKRFEISVTDESSVSAHPPR